MKLVEFNQPNKEISKSYLNYMFKAARSGQDDTTKDGTPKLNLDGTNKKRAKPLSPAYGERRALRGTPTASSHQKTKKATLGPILGSGGETHSPISPMDAAKELSRISGDMATGQSLPYSQLPEKADSFEAVTMRNKRSAPNRSATWENGAKWDKDSAYYGMNRTVIAPDGSKKVAKSRPSSPKETPRAEPRLLSPGENRRRNNQLKFKRIRKVLSKKKPPAAKKVYKKRGLSSGKRYLSGTIDENFGKSLDKALGL